MFGIAKGLGGFGGSGGNGLPSATAGLLTLSLPIPDPGSMIKAVQSKRIDRITCFLMKEPSSDTHTEGSRRGWCEESGNVLISEQWSLWKY